jgi:amino acid transporter
MSITVVLLALVCGFLIWLALRKDKLRRLFAIPFTGFLLGSFVLLRRLFFIYEPTEKLAAVWFAIIFYLVSLVVFFALSGVFRLKKPTSEKVIEISPQKGRSRFIQILVSLICICSIVFSFIPTFNREVEDVWKKNDEAFHNVATSLFIQYDEGYLKLNEMITYDNQQKQIYYDRKRLQKDAFGDDFESLCKKNQISNVKIIDKNIILFNGNMLYQAGSGVAVVRNTALLENYYDQIDSTMKVSVEEIGQDVYLFHSGK